MPPQPPTWRSPSRSPPAAEARPGQPRHPHAATTRPGQPRQGGDGARGWLEDGQAAASTTSGLPDLASSGDAREDGRGNGGGSGEGKGRGQRGSEVGCDRRRRTRTRAAAGTKKIFRSEKGGGRLERRRGRSRRGAGGRGLSRLSAWPPGSPQERHGSLALISSTLKLYRSILQLIHRSSLYEHIPR